MKYSSIGNIGILLVCLILVGCKTLAQKQDLIVRQGVHATKDALEVGRVDIAKQYIDEVAKIIPPPPSNQRKRVFAGKNNKNQGIVVLPKHLIGQEVVVVGTVEWDKVLDESKELRDQIQSEQQAYEQYRNQVDNMLIAKAKELDRLKAESEKYKKSSWFGWIFKSLGFLLPLGGIGLIAACVINPAIIPIVIKVFSIVIEIVSRLIYGIINGIRLLIAAIQNIGKSNDIG